MRYLTGLALLGAAYRLAIAAPEAPAGGAPPAPAKPMIFAVKGYDVEGNTLLTQGQIAAALKDHAGPAVSFESIRQALGELQLAYRRLGYVTVSVALPRQQLTNGIVKVRVTEGRLSEILVTGNVYYSSNNVRRALPSLATNVLLNSRWFQPELDQANANPDRQIYPVIGPGAETGASALTLKVKDRLPLHGHLEVDDKAIPGTPLLHIDSALQYNNLWQEEHQLGAQYNFTPQAMKLDDRFPRFYDQPLMATYSGFYRVPFRFGGGLREDYERLPVDFGYDQITRSFRFPAPSGNPELIVYAARSSSETPIRYGSVMAITNTALDDISSQFAQRDLSVDQNLGAKFSLPLPEFAKVRSTLTFGVDYKYHHDQSFSTNLTYFTLYALDEFGNRVLVRQDTIPLGTFSEQSVYYLPLSIGWSASRPDASGLTSFNVSQNVFLAALAAERSRFQAVAGSPRAGGDYTTINAGVTREQKLPHEWSMLFRANGQWASAPLIGNEQFALGGVAGVRGYQEGEEYGDSGWRVLWDLRAPPLAIGVLPLRAGSVPVHLRCSTFLDYGERYLSDPPPTRRSREEMLGAGLGFYVTAGETFDARLTLAWAILDTPGSNAGSARAYFGAGLQF